MSTNTTEAAKVLTPGEVWSVQRVVNSIANAEVKHGADTAERYGRLGETITHLMQAHALSLRAVCRETETSTRMASQSVGTYEYAKSHGVTAREAWTDWAADRNPKTESVTFQTFYSVAVRGVEEGENETDPLAQLDKAGKQLAKFGVATPKVVRAAASHLDAPTVEKMIAELQDFLSKLSDDSEQAA